jgi:hypothetical protein
MNNLSSKVKSLTKDLINWSKNDFGLVTDDQYNERLEKCKACERWNPTGFNNTGECSECGCSTIVKLKLTTSKCPLDIWKEIT